MASAWGMRRAGFGVAPRLTDRELRKQALELEIKEQGLGRSRVCAGGRGNDSNGCAGGGVPGERPRELERGIAF